MCEIGWSQKFQPPYYTMYLLQAYKLELHPESEY